MNSSLFSVRSLGSGHVCCAIVLLGISAGCADMVTYSRDSERAGIKLYNEGNYADAAGAFRNAARQNPRDYHAFFYMGACYDQLGQYQQAIQSYRTALRTMDLTLEGKADTEGRFQIVNGLANAIARSDQRDIETNAAAHDAQTSPNGMNWFILARIYTYRGDPDSAIDAYNHAALLEPQNVTFVKEYGLYLERIGQKQQAEAPLRRAYTLNNEDPQVVAALRRIGIVPGPSINDESQLAKPLIPKGPIPEVDMSKLHLGGSGESSDGGAEPTVQAPRD